jgi:two-component system, NtrC family, response regulator GlrR
MKQKIALLFDRVKPSSNCVDMASALTRILESHFEVSAVGPNANAEAKPALAFVVLPDIHTEDRKLESFLHEQGWTDLPYIAVVEECRPEAVSELLQQGAADFVTLPLKPSEVLPRVWRALNRRVSETRTADTLKNGGGFQHLVGESHAFIAQVRKIPLIAKSDVNVLIAGETGTGKEVYARAIHYSGSRAGGPFIAVNCGAIPAELVENELFGHERGAFTSAQSAQTGLIEEADGGTLFLDEIDCLPIFSQVKLLRFLQDKEYRPLGSTRIRRANVRIIAASNLNLEEAVGNGKLRQDLFYRLNIISFTLPPLRERRDDIPILAKHFLHKYCREFDRAIPEFSTEALRMLMAHSWPGNVRELEHVIERATVLCEGETIRDTDLAISNGPRGVRLDSLQEAKAREIALFEKKYIQGLLSACRGNITRAAEMAQKNRRAFFQLIQKHHIDVARFRSRVS